MLKRRQTRMWSWPHMATVALIKQARIFLLQPYFYPPLPLPLLFLNVSIPCFS